MKLQWLSKRWTTSIDQHLSRFGGAVVVLLLIAFLVITPWLVEKWVIYQQQIGLQTAGTSVSQQLELHLRGLERQAWLRASDLREPYKTFEQKSTEWLNFSEEILAIRLINTEGQTRLYAWKLGMPSSPLQLLPSQSLAMAHSQELNTYSYSAVYELAGKKVVDLYLPLSQQTGMTLATTLDTSAWSVLAVQQLATPEISATVTPYRTDQLKESHSLIVNHPSWEGHWSIELTSREFTSDIFKILRPVFGIFTIFILFLSLFLFRDHKLRLRAEKDVIEKSRLLEKQSHLSMLGEMSASLAHEINQPLAIISNYAVAGQLQLQHEEKLDAASLQKILQKIQEQSHRAAQVLVSVRGMLQQGLVQSVRSDVNQLIKHMIPHLRQQALLIDVKVNFEAQKNLFSMVDPILFEQVLLNLFKNSLQSLENSNLIKKEILITATALEETIKIEVTDTGSGIEPEIEHQIFDPFFTTKKDGLGIGLNLCRSVIERFQGRLMLQTNNGEGVCFVIELPRCNRFLGTTKT